MRRGLIVAMTIALLAMACGTALAEADRKPTLGVVVVLTDILRAEKNLKPSEWLQGAVERKISPDFYQRGAALPPEDFITFLTKKDIQPDASGLFKELMLPMFIDYGKNKQVDFLLVVIGDASVTSHIGTQIEQHTDADNKTWISTHDERKIDFADVRLRAALVDVNKNEYAFNTVITKRSGAPDLFGNPFRSVINDGMKKALAEFDAKISIP